MGFLYGELRFMILFSLGGLGPLFSTFILKYKLKKRRGLILFIKQIFKLKLSLFWYFWIFIVPVFLFAIPWLKYNLSSGYNIQLFGNEILVLFSLIPMNILFGGLEEVGWRGFLLPQLLKYYSIFSATLITSIIWSLWHLPLWFIVSSPQQNMNPVFFIIIGLSFSFLLSTVYTETKSIFLCIILHSIFNSYPAVINMPIQNLYFDSLLMLLFAFIVFYIHMKIN